MCVELPTHTLGQQPGRYQKGIVERVLGTHHLTELLVQTITSSTARFLEGNFGCYPLA